METYNGHVRTPNDAIILFEACRLGLLPRVQRRLSEKERQSIRSGSVFVWDEREAGMRRWTDGKSWSASRVSGSFLTYREMEGKRGGNNFVTPVNGQQNKGNKTPESGPASMDDPMDGEEGPDGYRYKPDGLMKQSFSLTTSQGQHLHLISYFSRSTPTAMGLRQPSNDHNLQTIQIPKGMYPESTVADASNTPAVTRSPMPGAPNYVMTAGGPFVRQPPQPPPGFMPGFIPHPGYMYPISPMHTPPGAFPYPYAHPLSYYHPAAFGPPPPPPPPPPPHHHQAPPSSYDQRPQRMSMPVPRSPQRTSASTTNGNMSYSQDKPPSIPTTNTSSYPITPGSERAPSVQIDPRLTESASQSAAQSTNSMPQLYSQSYSQPPLQSYSQPQPQPQTEMQRQDSQQYQPMSSGTNASSITSLVNAAAQASPLPSKKTTEAEAERQGSVSPGGTRYGAPPQDIPSEKLAFREDKMALSKLDRVFARV
ncbi:Gluconate transport-inducing protein [Knufia obscura]|uniref:Gluconate transport-inducing protein n=2 Tax=Knufia TaxID=430999 RepID=A0AAN8EWG3_9EURO|nr:Gluconate transport-inducing protein [Knufia obscura]KAK5957615.1 Gluconate transport-inducing protein [Knufia fluminis]